MPLFCKYGCGDADIYVWQVAETVEELLLLVDDATRVAAAKFAGEKRRAEWLAVRALLKSVFGEGVSIKYDAAGKPVLNGNDAFISISHTRDFVAFAVSRSFSVGLDIESVGRVVGDAASRYFMRSEELEHISAEFHDSAKLIRWTASEAVFKLVGDLGGNYRDNIVLENLQPATNGVLSLSLVGLSLGNGHYSVSYIYDGPLLLTLCYKGAGHSLSRV